MNKLKGHAEALMERSEEFREEARDLAYRLLAAVAYSERN